MRGRRRWRGSWSSSRGGSRTPGRGRRTGEPWGNSWGGARREGSGCATSRRSTWPRTSGLTWPRSACSATGSSVSQVLPVNPAAAVRGPKHVVTKGATPVLSPAEARQLLTSQIDTGALSGLRDLALLSVMPYSFARVSAVLGMRRQDYFGVGEPGVVKAPREGRQAARRPGPPPGRGRPRRVRRGGRARGARRQRSSRPSTRRGGG